MQLALDTAPTLEFRVAGVPQPKGSKAIIGRHVRIAGRLAVVAPQLIESADQPTKTHRRGRLRRWQAKVRAAASAAWRRAFGEQVPWDCSCELAVEFVLPRPAGDWLRPGQLRAGAREDCEVKPDLSKLVRAVEDALTGVVYTDDARVVRYGETWKRYAAWGGHGGAIVKVRPLR